MEKRGLNTQEAIAYLGVKRRAFEMHFRPFLPSARFGTSVIYDRLDLDIILDQYKNRNGRPVTKGESRWAVNKVVCIKMEKGAGALIRSSKDLDFEKVSLALKKLKAG